MNVNEKSNGFFYQNPAILVCVRLPSGIRDIWKNKKVKNNGR